MWSTSGWFACGGPFTGREGRCLTVYQKSMHTPEQSTQVVLPASHVTINEWDTSEWTTSPYFKLHNAHFSVNWLQSVCSGHPGTSLTSLAPIVVLVLFFFGFLQGIKEKGQDVGKSVFAALAIWRIWWNRIPHSGVLCQITPFLTTFKCRCWENFSQITILSSQLGNKTDSRYQQWMLY